MVAHEVKDIELNREIFDIDDEATENPSASGLNEPETEMALHVDGISSSPTPPAAAVIAVAAALNSNKGQIISEGNCGVLNFPKKQWNYLRISGLASKMGQIKKIKALYYTKWDV